MRIVTADPNWSFDDKIGKRGADKVYTTSPVDEICALGPLVQAVAGPDAVLALWMSSSQPKAADQVMEAWGFAHKQIWVWRKLTVHGKPHFGMGRLARAEKETIYVGTRGKAKTAVRNEKDWFDAKMPTWALDGQAYIQTGKPLPWPAGRYAHLLSQRKGNAPYIHSAKPEELQDQLERMFPDATDRFELYARRVRPGWHCLGNEVPGDGRDLFVSLTYLLEELC